MKSKVPRLPALLDRKIYKTGQTRGADDDVIFQNRVGRNSTVVIPYSHVDLAFKAPDNNGKFENGYIVLLKPEQFFASENFQEHLKNQGVELGKNALLFYETREQWNTYNPDDLGLEIATARQSSLGGIYVARVPSLTTEDAAKILRGYTNNNLKGAGIRVYEYASQETIALCRIQLELLFWHCANSMAVARFSGMTDAGIDERIKWNREAADKFGLSYFEKLTDARILNKDKITICPLCLKPLSANGFLTRLEQAEGREVPDLTVTEINLFHIKELRMGEFNHKPYNLGWGHHHCNVVTKDSGIIETLKWMEEVLKSNVDNGYIVNN